MTQPLPEHDEKSNCKGVLPFTKEQEQEGMEEDATIVAKGGGTTRATGARAPLQFTVGGLSPPNVSVPTP